MFRESRSVKNSVKEVDGGGVEEADADEEDMAVTWERARSEPWSVVCDVTELRRGVDEDRMWCPKSG
jgi:hypothetical protein